VIGLRRELPEHLRAPYRAFLEVVEILEPAKAGLTNVVPGARLPGRPLRDAVTEYLGALDGAGRAMATWRCPDVETEWRRCAEGLSEAAARAGRVLSAPGDPEGFQGLLWTVERLLDPLDPFVAAAERFSKLKRRRRRTD
jgi:hypothetical protein